MHAGRLRHQITIQQKTVTGRDAVGGEVKDWTAFATWWADTRPIRGTEFVSLRVAQSDITLRFVGRFLEGVTPQMRVLWDGNPFEIVEAINVNGRSRELELLCRGPAQATA